MNIPLVLRTLRYLRLSQLIYQVKYRAIKPRYNSMSAPLVPEIRFMVAPIHSLESLSGKSFTFLNLTHDFIDWNFKDYGMLWAYNLNYMDWLSQDGMTAAEGAGWIDKFIADLPGNKIGLDPYPTALRGINWIKFISANRNAIDPERLKRWNDSLYSQYRLLEKKLERHLLGNHLLEDLYSLYVASIYFNDGKMFNRYSSLLKSELEEQILGDGAHYEQSPMYHCILLERLLDCYNISTSNVRFDGQEACNDFLKRTAVLMSGHLSTIVYKDGHIPLLNDSAEGIAPSPERLFKYAQSLGIEWDALPLKESGYRKCSNERYEAVIDIGNLTASYQPGHSHADSLNYELRIDGAPFVVDTGISTYNKNERRQYERSTVAHNCVSPDGVDSSEVWGGFRVGSRCRVEVIEDNENLVVASHDGFKKSCKRKFSISDEGFAVEDWYAGDAISYIHLAEGVDPKRIHVDGASDIRVKDCSYSTEYNKFHNGKVVEIHFNGHVKYTIR